MSPRTGPAIDFRTCLYYCFLLVLGLLFVSYAVFQARFLLAGPTITFSSQMATVQTERMVYLEGNATNIVKLALNDREIYTDKYGNFKEALILENGYTIATLEAHDRYGRTESVVQTFVYTPALARE